MGRSLSIWSKRYFLIILNIQNLIEDCAENVQRPVFVASILVAAIIAVGVLTVRAVLVTSLETLAEVVLILTAVDIFLVTDRSTAINVRSGPAAHSVSVSFGTAGTEALSVALVHGLP